MGDAGLTGRKIIVDTYGGYSRHGGGAFSGKDPTKVDRSACYMARYVAKNLVAAGLARRAEVQLAYAIGVAEPVSVMVDSFGTGTIPDEQMTDLIRAIFSLTPRGIIETLDLRRPIYRPTAAFGHFGRSRADVHLGAHGQGGSASQGSRRCARREIGARRLRLEHILEKQQSGRNSPWQHHKCGRGRRQRHRPGRAGQAQDRMGQSADARSAARSASDSSRSSRSRACAFPPACT